MGLLATIQDRGRSGFMEYGITEGGAMDGFAYRLGQRLLTNCAQAAAIEVVANGLQCETGIDTTIAVPGAPVDLHLNDAPAPMNTALRVAAGTRIALGRAKAGVYSYLSVAGGILSPQQLSSRSVVVREGLGRPLRSGDALPLHPQRPTTLFTTRVRERAWRATLTLRFIPGFQYDDVSAAVRQQLETTPFTAGSRRDRMAIRLTGDPLPTGCVQLWSEATCHGAIQVPPDGHPLILLADRQTVGGYPKLGAVLSVDCERLSQTQPGCTIRFQAVTPQEAERVLWLGQNYERELQLSPVGEAG